MRAEVVAQAVDRVVHALEVTGAPSAQNLDSNDRTELATLAVEAILGDQFGE